MDERWPRESMCAWKRVIWALRGAVSECGEKGAGRGREGNARRSCWSRGSSPRCEGRRPWAVQPRTGLHQLYALIAKASKRKAKCS